MRGLPQLGMAIVLTYSMQRIKKSVADFNSENLYHKEWVVFLHVFLYSNWTWLWYLDNYLVMKYDEQEDGSIQQAKWGCGNKIVDSIAIVVSLAFSLLMLYMTILFTRKTEEVFDRTLLVYRSNSEGLARIQEEMVASHIKTRMQRNYEDYADRVINAEVKRIWMSVVGATARSPSEQSYISEMLTSKVTDADD